MTLNKNRLHEWEERYKERCFVNMQKNLQVYNLKTKEDDFIFKGVRLYQADDVDKIRKEVERELLKEIINNLNLTYIQLQKIELLIKGKDFK